MTIVRSGTIPPAGEWINDYVGLPHVTNGRERKGCDCWGLMILVWRERRGIELPDWRAPNDASFLAAVEEVGARYGDWPKAAPSAQVDEPTEWDFVVCLRRTVARHVGLYINGGVLHSPDKQSVWEPASRFFLNNPTRSYWRWLG